jgi:hypothetical protein
MQGVKVLQCIPETASYIHQDKAPEECSRHEILKKLNRKIDAGKIPATAHQHLQVKIRLIVIQVSNSSR